jgi:hypothetical protein
MNNLVQISFLEMLYLKNVHHKNGTTHHQIHNQIHIFAHSSIIHGENIQNFYDVFMLNVS